MTTYNNNTFYRSMHGLNSVDADSVDTTNLVCDTLSVNTIATAPTVANSDNSTNIATTAWVTNHAESLTLQNVYDNSKTQPQIVINSNGALQIKSDGIQANIFELLDSLANTVLAVSEDGLMYVNDIHVNDINGNNANGEINIGLTLNSGIIGIGNTNKMTIDQDGDVTINLLKTNDIDFEDIGSNMDIGDGAMRIQPNKEINTYGLFRSTSTFVSTGNAYMSNLRTNNMLFNNDNANMTIGSNDGTGTVIIGGNNCPQLKSGITPSVDDDITNKKYVDDSFDNPTSTTMTCNIYNGTSNDAIFRLGNNITSGRIYIGDFLTNGDVFIGPQDGGASGCETKIECGIITLLNNFGDLTMGNLIRNTFLKASTLFITSTLPINFNSSEMENITSITTDEIQCDLNNASSASSLMKISDNVTSGNIEIGKNLNSGSGITVGSLTSGSSTTLNGGNILINASNGKTRFVADSYLMKSFQAGVILIDDTGTIRHFPVYYSCPNLNNLLQQTNTGGTINAISQSGGSVVGTWSMLSTNNISDKIILLPNYGVIAYANTNYGGSIIGDFKNNTMNPICFKLSSINNTSSIKVYWNDEEQLIK